jgi:hypothetical protein
VTWVARLLGFASDFDRRRLCFGLVSDAGADFPDNSCLYFNTFRAFDETNTGLLLFNCLCLRRSAVFIGKKKDLARLCFPCCFRGGLKAGL